ncbi:SPOR domain-containing protein [Sulfurivirga sp.]|uniref:SPOR domain-containing protein n=1 Tax=Sulfurivirga sp. TaxID=2614236 RepID=UPI0025F6160B|nr:SPOR domain-containing protein [Sulfurivirga sp.]
MLSPQSDFERERQRILAEIESRARSKGGELTLQDWLKAAEEVMPDADAVGKPLSEENDDVVLDLRHAGQSRRGGKQQSASRPQQSSSSQSDTSHLTSSTGDAPTMNGSSGTDRRTLIYTSLIGVTLMALTLGAGGLAWLDLKRQVEAVTAVNTQLRQQVADLKMKVDTLEKQMATGGDSARFDALVERVARLEQNGGVAAAPVSSPSSDQVREQVQAELNNANVITEAVLDAKLAQLSQRIEQVIDKRFTAILTQIKSLRTLETQRTGETVAPPDQKKVPEEDREKPEKSEGIPAPVPPKTPDVKLKAAAPGELTASEQWLRAQPGGAWLLQLASVLDRGSLVKLRQRKKLNDARIVRQQRIGRTFYVLVQGIYPDRETAQSAADEIRKRTGINPWVRRVRALQKSLPTAE